jgi:hypothetical protein
MPVEEGAVVPTSSGDEAGPVGWETLDLDRGIPFMPARPRPAPPAGVAPGADGRRTLFQRAAPDSAPVSIAYCVDPSVGQTVQQRLRVAGRALRLCVGDLGKQDRVALVVADAEGRVLVALTAADPQLGERIEAAVAQLTPAAPGPLAPGLRRVPVLGGVTHVILVASADGPLSPEDEQWFREPAKAGVPRLIALMVGDRTATPRAVALRGVAARTSGAFAWLRAGE